MRRYLPLVLAGLFALACSTPPPGNTNPPPANGAMDFEKLTDDLLYGSLALSPVGATQAGYHEHDGVQLDEQIDDFSAAGIEAQRRFYDGLTTRINALNAASLDKEQQ